jgi:hypothetical protein
MKAIQGYVTDDGEFFEDRQEADFHERKVAMKSVLEADGMSEDILEWIDKRQREIGNYLRIEVTPGGQVNARRYIQHPKKPA